MEFDFIDTASSISSDNIYSQ